MHNLSGQLGRRALEAWMRGRNRGLAQARAGADGVGHVYVLAPVGAFFGDEACTALSFAADLQAVSGCRSVTVHVSSPGGDCEEGFAVANMLVEFGRTHDTTTVVESCAASVASVIALAGNRVLMASPEAEMMIHQAWGVAVGNAADLVTRAERLRQLNESMVSFYARHTGQTEDAVRALMASGDRYMKAPECIALGFADGLLGAVGPEPSRASADRSTDQRRRILNLRSSQLGASARMTRASAGK